MQQSPEEETPFVYVTLATLVTLATAGYIPCLFGYVTIGLARHNRTHFSQSERLLVKPKRPCTDLCAEPVAVWNRLVLSIQIVPYILILRVCEPIATTLRVVVSLYLTDDKSTLVQVMTWCPQAASHYLNKCRPRSMSTCGVPEPQWVNIFYYYFHIVFLIISHHDTLS